MCAESDDDDDDAKKNNARCFARSKNPEALVCVKDETQPKDVAGNKKTPVINRTTPPSAPFLLFDCSLKGASRRQLFPPSSAPFLRFKTPMAMFFLCCIAVAAAVLLDKRRDLFGPSFL